MAVATTSLQEMGIFLIRSLDAKKGLIENITTSSDGGTIKYKSGESAPIKVASQLTPNIFCNGYVIVKNNRENVQSIIDSWESALKFEKMVLIFLDEKSGNKWLLRPHVHVKIAEPKTLAQDFIRTFYGKVTIKRCLLLHHINLLYIIINLI